MYSYDEGDDSGLHLARRLSRNSRRRSGEGTGSPVALRHKDAGQESVPDFANTEATSSPWLSEMIVRNIFLVTN